MIYKAPTSIKNQGAYSISDPICIKYSHGDTNGSHNSINKSTSVDFIKVILPHCPCTSICSFNDDYQAVVHSMDHTILLLLSLNTDDLVHKDINIGISNDRKRCKSHMMNYSG